MFGFSRRRIRLGRTKVQLGDSAQGLRSPVRHTKRPIRSSGENAASAKTRSRELKSGGLDTQSVPEVNCSNNYASGNFKNWVELSTSGEKPAPRFSHAATVIGSKMVVVGGDSGHGLLDDVQILDFNRLVWSTTKAVPKGHFSPSSLPSKVPPCKGHCLVSWGEKVLLVGGKSNPAFERVSVWSFDIETECWSRVEAKGDIPVARSGHSVTRSGSVLILFGGEDSKGRKLNDLHMFDLKTFMWLPLHYTGTGPSPRSNHVAALYNDRMLIIFGGAAKSKILNDLYSLDFETMVWSRLKTHGFHPSPRSGCCGVLYGSKWYITGGGSKKKRYAETWVFNVLKVEWSVVATQPSSSVTTNKGISLVFVQHKEKSFFVAFGGNKKEVSNQVEIFLVEQGRQPISENAAPERGLRSLDNCAKLTTEYSNRVTPSCPIDNIAKQKLKSALEQNGTSRKSLSEASIDQTSGTANVSLRKQFHQEEECSLQMKMQKDLEEDRIREHEDHMVSSNPSLQSQKTKPLDCMFQVTSAKSVISTEPDSAFIFDNENNTRDYHKQSHLNASSEEDGALLEEFDEKTGISNACQLYEAKLMATLRKNSSLEGQLSAALASREAMEKYLSTVMKSRQEMERKLVDSLRDIDLLKEKLASSELAQEEVNSLSNIVHSDNVRLEHDVAFLKAVLDDTQKELHSTRGVLAGERARAFQLQVEVFHLKQRLQTMENRTPTPRKPLNA